MQHSARRTLCINDGLGQSLIELTSLIGIIGFLIVALYRLETTFSARWQLTQKIYGAALNAPSTLQNELQTTSYRSLTILPISYHKKTWQVSQPAVERLTLGLPAKSEMPELILSLTLLSQTADLPGVLQDAASLPKY